MKRCLFFIYGVTGHLLFLACFAAAAIALWYAPAWLDRAGLDLVTTVSQLGAPLLAAICCFAAALRSRGDDRLAWVSFEIAPSL